MKIFLIGLPGSGKTTLGRLLAEKMTLPFVDLDEEIEKSEGLTVAQVFEKKTEGYFREEESKLLKEFCALPESFVMATGGGTPCFHHNMALMNESGKTVFLNVPANEIVSRITKTDQEERPLIAGHSHELDDKIGMLLAQRIDFYKQAQLIVEGSALTTNELFNKIIG